MTGPYTTAPACFPVKAGYAGKALYCHAGYGPCFSLGLYVGAASGPPTDCYDEKSECMIGNGYDDVLGRAKASLTGTQFFTPFEVEVFAVSRA